MSSSPPDLNILLTNLPLGKFQYFERIGSTNDEAANWIKEECPDLSLLVADTQTAGRGSAGRKWFTPPGAGLAFSLVLRADEILHLLREHGNTARLNGLGSLAVCQALQTQFDIPAQIKWPNDVIVEGRKLSGILAEAHWIGNELAAVVLGIGLNITPASIPPKNWDTLNPRPYPAACLEAVIGAPVDRWALLGAILRQIFFWRENLTKQAFLDAWEANLAFRGQWVQVYPPGSAIQPQIRMIRGLESDGSLRVQDESGEQSILRAGEIHKPNPPLVGFGLRPVDSAEK